MATQGPTDLRAYICIQDKVGKAEVTEAPLSNYTEQKQTALAKRDLADMILYLRHEACQDNVSDTYVRDAITKNSITIVMFERKVTSSRDTDLIVDTPKGFILARLDNTTTNNNNDNNNDNDNHNNQNKNNNNQNKNNNKEDEDEEEHSGIYIDIICAAAYGSHLLKFFIEMIEEGDDVDYIKLSSLPSVLAYYPKFNFKFRKSCNTAELATVPDVIIKRKKDIKPFPKTTSDAYADDDFSSFMLKLHQKGLAVEKDSPCDKLIIDKKTLIKSDCGAEGYTMMRCKSKEGGRRKTYRKSKKNTRRTSYKANRK